MESLLKLQVDCQLKIEKARSNFKKTPKDRLTQMYMETRLEILDACWKSFLDNHKEITRIATNEDLEYDYFVNDRYEATEESYVLYKTELKDALARAINSATVVLPNLDPNAIRTNVKLPKISIPIFSGKYDEWTTFKDLFTALVERNVSLDNVEKLHYLKTHLSGEAEQLLRHVPITAANYRECWNLLTNRYNNKRYLSNCLLKRLMSQPNIATESSSAIKELLDTTIDCLSGLKNLGIDTNSWDIVIIYVISHKLDPTSRRDWEVRASESTHELPTLKDFKEFLEHKFRALEFLDSRETKPKPINVNKPKVLHALDGFGANSSSDNVAVLSCPFCKDNHKIYNCKGFAKQDYDSRHNFVQTNGLCFNCLGTNHSVKFCRAVTTCRTCRRKHHSLLHPQPESNSAEPTLKVEVESNNAEIQTEKGLEHESVSKLSTHFSKSVSQILLATALVETRTEYGNVQLFRALVDQGSQASFITESSVQLLGLQKTPCESVISGLGGDKTVLVSKFAVELTVQSRLDPTFSIQVRAHVLSTITALLPAERITHCNWPELQGIALADPEYHTPNKIDILLGAEVYGLILEEGKLCHNAVVNRHISLHTQVEEFENINELLKQFWELESDDLFVNRKKLFSEEEQKCEEFYNNTTKRDADGRYIVKLPFRDEDPQCKYGKSRSIAVKRFRLLEARFKKNPEFKARYAEVIHEYLDLGHMERVQKEDTKESEAVYLPHHAVIRDDKATTKIRVVFDASCKGSNGISLNDTLMIGPTLQSDLRHIIMRWRMHPICLSADIVKMYRQVRVSDQDADFQRLVWRDDPASEMEDYRIVRVTFGTASAPYLAVKTLQQLAHDEGMNYFAASEKLINDYYVDDLMTGCQTVEEGLHLYQEMKDLLAKGGFDISKWDTNNEELAREILEEDDNQEGTLDIKIDNIVKILGLFWERTSDNFKYSVQLPPLQEPVTKRKVISDISRLFDPLGWAAPCVITAKVMMQKLWLAGINWDEELPPELLREWKTYRMELISTRELRIPRWIECTASDSEVELHGFCDASNMAYAAVVYLRVVDKTGDVKVNLVTAKTKVAPTKQTSIPRLELLGAVLLARLINEVAEVLSIPRLHVHGWTDSMVVLAWLSGHPSRWTTFVGNRVSEILERMENTQWAHVRSGHNPADIASRGMSPSELSQTSMWGNGPLWLKNRTIDYTRPKTADTDPEQRRIKSHVVTNPLVQDEAVWTKYSSLLKLVRVIAYCKRIFKVRQPNQKMESYLTSQEMAEALEVCIRQCQGKEFEQEIEDIHKTGEVNNGSKLKPLCPFLDEQGILRVGGRLHNADLNENVKHPIIIPPKSHLTNLIVNEAHLKTLHGGPLLMQNHLRSKYWVISAKILTKTHVRKCVICIRHAAATKNQLMGQLPSSRVTPRRPFLHSGVDFAGPINIRVSKGRGNKSYKGYICIFVCMATKAIHLEAISDLTAQGFIAGFKRFVARRGHCSDVWSDNGTNFVGASRELQALVDAEQSFIAIELRTWLSTNNVTWHFIPPHAPNFGGLWEAGVKSAKFHLKRVIGNSTLTYEEMSTVLAQIEACLNSRPLCQISDNINDPTPLTPGHFIVGEPLTIVPEHNYERSNIGNLRRWQVTQRMIQDFWRRWSHEYMLQLLQRYKWAKISPQPKLGDVVLIKEDNLPPARWLLGKIESTQPGLDGVTRVVTLKCNGSLIKRPTSKLCILPVSD